MPVKVARPLFAAQSCHPCALAPLRPCALRLKTDPGCQFFGLLPVDLSRRFSG
jgi:hypothetical protein